MQAMRQALAAGLLMSSATLAQAAVAWDESVGGDLSGNGLAPTAVVLVPGDNTLRGTTGRGSSGVDRDYFVFELPAGWQLETLTVMPGTTFLGSSAASFIGVQAGPQVTVNPTGGSATGLLGWTHYSENDLGTDILGLMGIGPGAIGFAGPLPAGTYSFWIQETGSGVANYEFTLAVGAVPEPAAWAMWLLALAGAAAWRRGGRLV